MSPSKLSIALLAAGLCGAGGAPAFAGTLDDRIQALEKRLQGSALVIEQLSARLAELERKAAAEPPPPAAPATVAAPAALAALQDSVNQLSESMSRSGGNDGGLALHGFADVGAAWSSRDDPARLRGFNAGSLDLYLTPQFGDRVKGLVELAVEYTEDGEAAVDLERLQLGYTISDALTVWLGRFHTPFGLWNTAFHHGAQLQTSISRPRFIEFEDKGGILPAHSVGVWASGKTGLGNGKVTYDGYLVNGPRIADRTLGFGAYTDNDANKMLGGNVGYQAGGALQGWTLGLHGLAATAQVHDGAGSVISATRLRMAGAYLAYDENDWEVIGESYRFANVGVTDRMRRVSTLGFLQVGKTWGAWTPWARWERAALDPQDDYFRSQAWGRSYRRLAFGLRYAIDTRSSFKFELGQTRESAVDLVDDSGAPLPFAARAYRRAALQYSVAF